MSEQEGPNFNRWQDHVVQPIRPPVAVGDTLEAALARAEKIIESAKEFRARLELHVAGQPQTITCKQHPHHVLKIDVNRSSVASNHESEKVGEEVFKLVYDRCPECEIQSKTANESSWLLRAGVPALLAHGSFKTFRVENEEDSAHVEAARAFVQKRRGFLIMTGNLGDGKSLLAVAVMREFLGGKFITQNDLLNDLRRRYRDPKAEDVIRRCQQAKCLVIDDLGLSVGGSDELPMLQSILDHRYGEKIPTVITSNLTLDGIYDCIGARLTDRLKQSTYRVLRFNQKSSRPAERTNYFAD